MSSFDTVHFFCLLCDTEITDQSKAGECKLKNYHQKSVPAKIAEDLKGIQIICPNCETTFKVYCDVPRVVMNLSIQKLGEDYD